jgi:hypothetical protein
MKEDNLKLRLLLIAAGVLFILIVASGLLGCSVDKKAQRKEAWLISKDKLDDICARVYPNHDSTIVKDSVRFDTLYKDGPEVILHDTVYSVGDTIVKVITKQCPPVQVITKTVHDSVFIYRTNTAEVERLKGEVLAKEAQIKAKDDIVIKQQTKIDKNTWWEIACIITWSLFVLGFVVRFFVVKRPI